MTPCYAPLDHRGVLAVSGPDARTFLQGLVTQDVGRATPERAVHGALLTPQGRFLHDFFLIARGRRDIWLETEAGRLDDLAARLMRYRLRARVEIAAVAGMRVLALWGDGAAAAAGLGPEAGAAADHAGGVAFVDPRLAAMGARAVLPQDGADGDVPALRRAGLARADVAAWDARRLALGVPDGSRDLVVGKTILLEANFDVLNGLDWDKGCYTGQELTARTRYRGLIKRRLVPVRLDGQAPPAGTAVTDAAGAAVGDLRSAAGDRALALLRLAAVAAAAEPWPFRAGPARLAPELPAWLPA